jgi:hypothetical protein
MKISEGKQNFVEMGQTTGGTSQALHRFYCRQRHPIA